MGPSVFDALSRAQERTRRTLFPFQFEKWIHLGFIAFLSQFAGGGFPSMPSFPNLPGSSSRSGAGGTAELFDGAWKTWSQTLSERLVLVGVLGVFALVLMTALGAGLLYVGCRGRFMFLEAVIHDRFAVREPWQRLREPAWNLFKVRFALGYGCFAFELAAAGAAAAIAWSDITARHFGPTALVAALLLAGAFLLLVPLLIFLALIDDFVVPIMYLEGVGVWEGWRRVRTRLLPGRALEILVFYALKIGLAMAAAFVAFVASCATCCVAALPYLSTLVLLPFHVFMQAFSLYFVESLGVPVFPVQPPPTFWQPTNDRFG
jgi:hypothetical protein